MNGLIIIIFIHFYTSKHYLLFQKIFRHLYSDSIRSFFRFSLDSHKVNHQQKTTKKRRMELNPDGNPLSPNEALFPKKRPGRSIFIGHKMSLHLITEDMIENTIYHA